MEIHPEPHLSNVAPKDEQIFADLNANGDSLQALMSLVSEQWNKVRSHGESPPGQ